MYSLTLGLSDAALREEVRGAPRHGRKIHFTIRHRNSGYVPGENRRPRMGTDAEKKRRAKGLGTCISGFESRRSAQGM